MLITPDAGTGQANLNWMFPDITDISIDHPSANSTHISMGMHFMNYLTGFGNKTNFHWFDISTVFKLVRILGLMAVLSYMIVILFTWIYANHQGYVYFSAGEPISLIKYPEWVLGFLGIFATASILRRELDNLIL
jgi:uncharacterized membrane protein YadS